MDLWLQPVRDAAQERTIALLTADGPGKRLVGSGGDEAAAAGAAAGASDAERKRLVRAAGNRKADWAAVTRVEYEEAEAEEGERWEREVIMVRHVTRTACLTRAAPQLTPLTPLLPLQVRGEAALAIEEERKIDDGAADEEEGNQVSLARDDEIEWPDEETEERLREHDELWTLDAHEREQLCRLWMHSKFEGVYVELSGLCEKYEAACREKARLPRSSSLRVTAAATTHLTTHPRTPPLCRRASTRSSSSPRSRRRR